MTMNTELKYPFLAELGQPVKSLVHSIHPDLCLSVNINKHGKEGTKEVIQAVVISL